MKLEDYSKYYIQSSDHYLVPKDIFSELFNEMINWKQECEELKKQLEEVEFIVGLRQKRNLISKFDKEYDEEDKKKNPNRDYAGIMPDAEEVYRRYYAMKNQQEEFINWLIENESLDDYCNETTFTSIREKYEEIIGDDK